ncbi:MAG: ABC transporter permease [Christensenellales bacterium]|jgi:ABC-type nitrate/sulfonate/bicarbonate transport system permease component
MRIKNKEGAISALCAALSIAAFLLLWQLASTLSPRVQFIPPPTVVFPAFLRSFSEPIGVKTMWGHIAASLLRVLAGFCASAAVGIVVGIACGRSKVARAIFNPFVELLRPIPGIAWIPISILWFGTGETSKVFILFIASVTMIAVNAHAGASSVDEKLIGAARMLGAGDFRVFMTVVLPSCVPQIFAGLQTGLTITWMTVVAAEMIRSEYGVGWVITAGNNSYNMTQVMVGILAIGIGGFLLSNLLRLAERRLCAWKDG